MRIRELAVRVAAMSIRIQRALIWFGRAGWLLLCFLLASPAWAYSTDVVLIRSAEGPTAEQDQMELATRFYGLDLKTVVVRGKSETAHLGIIEQRSTVAVAVEANALAEINRNALLKSLHRSSGAVIPLLILGVTPETDSVLLSSWSGFAAVGARRLESPTRLDYIVGRVEGVTQQLGGIRFPFPGQDTFYFALNTHRDAGQIMAVGNDNQVVPVFIEASLDRQPVFLLCKTRPTGTSAPDRDPYSVVDSFAGIAPVMMFVKYSAGERGWHAPHHYANFTIDDPWLREPYGALSYEGLLKEMEKHNFHTTIAFIPWNYDRSEAGVVALFRDHPERFSISIHGDNHEHREFEDLQSEERRAAALRQALARMEKFKLLTQIPYDPVFVFPHDIGSEDVFEKLKAYNYLATVNSTNVPSDRPAPLTPFFALRPVTTAFAGFPSVTRYPAGIDNPTEVIAISEFLENPLFFYSHHEFFAAGIDGFNRIADEVNRREPATIWSGLGEIASHLYLLKLRDDRDYDVLAFSNSLKLDNASVGDRVYHIEKPERADAAIEGVTLDGERIPFHVGYQGISLVITVPPGQHRKIVIRDANTIDVTSVSTAKNSIRVYFLRMASDFRDILLSKSRMGNVVTRMYYKTYLQNRLGLLLKASSVLLVAIAVGGCILLLLCRERRVFAKRSVSLPPDQAAGVVRQDVRLQPVSTGAGDSCAARGTLK
jgi:hypothetical protein